MAPTSGRGVEGSLHTVPQPGCLGRGLHRDLCAGLGQGVLRGSPLSSELLAVDRGHDPPLREARGVVFRVISSSGCSARNVLTLHGPLPPSLPSSSFLTPCFPLPSWATSSLPTAQCWPGWLVRLPLGRALKAVDGSPLGTPGLF